MELDLSWILIGLPLAFGLGWIASRLDLRQLRIANRQAPRAYFKGLNYLLNEQQDQAIDAFIEAVQQDPDTTDLHFALGNLFRRRGDYDRAVRVHQHLLQRADLSKTDRDRAQHALAMDFMRAHVIESEEQINTETIRYSCDIPAQALGYKIGSLKLISLRQKYRQLLGKNFSDVAFHDAILRMGNLPLTVLEKNLDRAFGIK